MADITMPQLGETVTEGTITKWHKQVGDAVAEDEVLFEVSTDKVDSEVPSPVAGVLTEILVPEGDTVDVGTRLAVISDRGAAAGAGQAGRRRGRSASRRPNRQAPPEPVAQTESPAQAEPAPAPSRSRAAAAAAGPAPAAPCPDRAPARPLRPRPLLPRRPLRRSPLGRPVPTARGAGPRAGCFRRSCAG